jgi:ElaB/YqjD/DUF883 family membrane-anchored ribosome-binding protein
MTMNATTQRGEGAGVRDAAELEREGDEIRADMGRTLNELERKFSPEQMMERSMNFLRENGSSVVEEIGTTVRNHPLPVLLTAAGLIWLTSSITQSKWKRSGTEASDDATYDDVTYSGADSEPSSHATQTSTLNTVRGKVSASMRAVREREQRAAASFVGLVQEQPLVLGALAVAAGALLGAALPMTRYENELLAQTQDGSASRGNGATIHSDGGTEQLQTETSQSYGATSAPPETARI